jgi:hypothetical protein
MGKALGKHILGRPGRIWEVNINMDILETGSEDKT